MNARDLLAQLPGTVTTYRIRCGAGVVKIRFARDKVLSQELSNYLELPLQELFRVLGALTHRVTLTIESPETKNKPIQLTVPVTDALEILGGEVPSEANFNRIHRRLMDRKNHGGAVPRSEPAEKSFGAQGQTKKPGSHSDGRHG